MGVRPACLLSILDDLSTHFCEIPATAYLPPYHTRHIPPLRSLPTPPNARNTSRLHQNRVHPSSRLPPHSIKRCPITAGLTPRELLRSVVDAETRAARIPLPGAPRQPEKRVLQLMVVLDTMLCQEVGFN